MKTRNGFVSNSSSSNFVVSAKDEASLVVEVTIRVDLTDYYRKHDAPGVFRCVADMDHCVDDMWDSDDARETTWYAAAKVALESGRVVFFGELDYHGDAFEQAARHTAGELKAVLAGNTDVEVLSYEEA